MEARQRRAHQLRHPVGYLVGILRDAAERDVTALALESLRLLEGAGERLGDLLGDSVARHRDRPQVDLLVLHEDQRGRLGTDVQHDRAAGKTGVRPLERIQHRHRPHVHDHGVEARRNDRIRDLRHLVELCGHDHRRCVALGRGPDELVVPHYVIDRERDLLLHLVAHELLELVRRDGRELREAGEHHLPVDGEVEGAGLDAGGLRRLAERRPKHGLRRSLGVPVEPGEVGRAVRRERKTRLPLHRVLGEHCPRGADVKCYDSCHCSW